LTILISTLAVLPGGAAELWDLMKSSEIDAKFAKLQKPLDVILKPNYTVHFRMSSGEATPWQVHFDADELWFVRRGAAKVTLADFTLMAGVAGPSAQPYDVGAGDVVNVPRDKAYMIAPAGSRFEYVAVRILPSERHTPQVGTGSNQNAKPMPPVVTKAQIEAKLASLDKNENLHNSGAVIINYIVAPPSWPKPSIPESHMTCDDFYSIRLGSARFAVDGYIAGAQEQPAGEIHGTSAVGAREYTAGVGDLVSIPRNTMHYMAPETPRFGYLLVKVCD
jgi:mannose-6-phosphate isomerase-like protein (cupin superfamily)